MNDQTGPLEFKDQSRRLFTAPFFAQRDADDLLAALVQQSIEKILPEVIEPILSGEIADAISRLAVLRAGDTMQGRLYLAYPLPTSDAEVASKLYVDMMASGITEPVGPGVFGRTAAGAWQATLALTALPLAIASGGTGTTTGPLALDALSGASGSTAGALSRSTAGAWSIGPAGITEPVGTGVFGRTAAGAWSGVLPLTGGTLTGTLNATILYQNGTALGTAPFLSQGGGAVTGPITLPGNATTALQAVPRQQLNHIPGVTDGSSAAPGEIGETIVHWVGTPTPVALPLTNATIVQVNSITLTPGDWDCGAFIQVWAPYPTPSQYTLAVYFGNPGTAWTGLFMGVTAAVPWTLSSSSQVPPGAQGMTLATRPWTVTTNTIVSLWVEMMGGTAPVSATVACMINARRVR